MAVHQVAVTVFCVAEGADYVDAGSHAAMAIRKALSGEQVAPMPYALEPVVLYPGRANEWSLEPVVVHDVMETGMAAGNGYLWLRPTVKSFPRREADDE